MVFTIEPILTLYRQKEVLLWEDQWTYQAPFNPSAQWEHMIRIDKTGNEILTMPSINY